MAFIYKTFSTSHSISDTKETLVNNGVSTDELYIRMIHLHNIDESNSVTVEGFLVPNVSGAVGTWNANDRFVKKTLSAGESVTFEYPVPGIILEHNDRLEFVADVAGRCNAIITGGRNYA